MCRSESESGITADLETNQEMGKHLHPTSPNSGEKWGSSPLKLFFLALIGDADLR